MSAPIAVTATREVVAAVVFAAQTLAEAEATENLTVSGDRPALEGLLPVLDTFTMMFPIVTP